MPYRSLRNQALVSTITRTPDVRVSAASGTLTHNHKEIACSAICNKDFVSPQYVIVSIFGGCGSVKQHRFLRQARWMPRNPPLSTTDRRQVFLLLFSVPLNSINWLEG